MTKIKECLCIVTLLSAGEVRKIIKEYENGFAFVLNTRTGLLDCYKDEQYLCSRFIDGSVESFVNGNGVLNCFSDGWQDARVKRVKLIAN